MAPPATVDAAETSARSRFLKAPGRVAPGDALRAVIIVALLLFVLLAVPLAAERVLAEGPHGRRHLLGRRARAERPHGPGRPGLARADRGARARGLGRGQADVLDLDAVPARAAVLGPHHHGARHLGRPAGAPSQRALPRADHADDGRGDHGRPRDHGLPERRPGLPGAHRVVARRRRHAAPARDRRDRPRLLPLHGGGGRPDVPDPALARPQQAGARLGGDPPERAGGARRGREHHALQALGVRPRVVPDRRGGRAAGGQRGRPLQLPVPHARTTSPCSRSC